MRALDVVKEIYGTYGKRDLDAVMEHFAEDAVFHWNADAEPARYCGACRGRAAIRDRLLSLAEDFEYMSFRALDYVDGGERIAAEIEMRLKRRTTGQEFVLRSANFWTIRDGKAVAMTEYYDTALAASMM